MWYILERHLIPSTKYTRERFQNLKFRNDNKRHEVEAIIASNRLELYVGLKKAREGKE